MPVRSGHPWLLPLLSVSALAWVGLDGSRAHGEPSRQVPFLATLPHCSLSAAPTPQAASETVVLAPRRSLLARVFGRPAAAMVIPDVEAAHRRAACARSTLEGCSALTPRRPDASWESIQGLQGLPEMLRLKADPCLDTWYRLVGRRDGWVHFDVTRTDRRPVVPDPQWLVPLRLEVSCASLHSRVGDAVVPVQRGSLGWVGAKIFC